MWVSETLSHNGTNLAWQFHVEFVATIESRLSAARSQQLRKVQVLVAPSETCTHEFSRLTRALVLGPERLVDAVAGGIAHR